MPDLSPEQKIRPPVYVGDGVYLRYSPRLDQYVLYTSDGVTEMQTIYLDSTTAFRLVEILTTPAYMDRA